MKLFLTLMAGENAQDAEPIFATADSDLIDAVMDRLGGMVKTARADALDEGNNRSVVGAAPRNKAAEA